MHDLEKRPITRMSARSSCPFWIAITIAMAMLMAGCASSPEARPTEPASKADAGKATPTPVEPTTPLPPRSESGLPEITTVWQAGGDAIRPAGDADWVLVAFGRAWVSGVGKGVGFYEARTGRLQGSVAVPQSPCGGMDSGFGAVWTATCGKPGIARIDPKTGKVTKWVAVDVPADGESSIGAGEGGIWAIADGDGCSGCVLVRIDPGTVRITDTRDVPEGGIAVRAGLGGIWITNPLEDRVVHVDARTGAVVSQIDVGLYPMFLDVGEGGVWVMNQRDGSVSHIDPMTDEVVATIPVDALGIVGGDLTVGARFVWLRSSDELVAQIDPTTDRVVARIGSSQASGSASAGEGRLWISAHVEVSEGDWVAKLYRIPLRDG